MEAIEIYHKASLFFSMVTLDIVTAIQQQMVLSFKKFLQSILDGAYSKVLNSM